MPFRHPTRGAVIVMPSFRTARPVYQAPVRLVGSQPQDPMEYNDIELA